MLLTPHTTIGIALGAALPNPILSVTLSLLSHFALDMVPHWDDVGLGEIELNPKPLKTRAFRLILLDASLSLLILLFFLYWAMPDYGVGITIAACVIYFTSLKSPQSPVLVRYPAGGLRY